MKTQIKKIIQKCTRKMGYLIIKDTFEPIYDPIIDRDTDFMKIYEDCKDYTMTSKERMYALYKAVQHIIQTNIKGDFVECGVWKGGSAMVIASTLKLLNSTDRKIYLYDTFEGMSEPTKEDYCISLETVDAIERWKNDQRKSHNTWCYSPLDEVKKNLFKTGYPTENLIFIKGKVEETIPLTMPQKIAVLRLDTDWYESTKHELIYLYPILEKNGILIVDDYGYWAGSKKAVDEYFQDKPILLTRIDDGGHIGWKI